MTMKRIVVISMLLLTRFLCFGQQGQTERSSVRCEILPITLHINGTEVDNKTFVYPPIKKGAVITFSIVNDPAVNACAYQIGKIKVWAFNKSGGNTLIQVLPQGEFSEVKSEVEFVLSAALYDKLKHQKKLNEIAFVIGNVRQKDQNGNISIWKRWDNGAYQFMID